jgi:hypothetical protein
VVLLHEPRTADAVHSPDVKRSLSEAMLLDVERFLAEAYFHSEKRSPPAGVCFRDAAHLLSLKRSVAEARYCVLPECCLPQRQVEECCSKQDAQPTASPRVELRHSWLQVYKVLLPVWPVHRH